MRLSSPYVRKPEGGLSGSVTSKVSPVSIIVLFTLTSFHVPRNSSTRISSLVDIVASYPLGRAIRPPREDRGVVGTCEAGRGRASQWLPSASHGKPRFVVPLQYKYRLIARSQ